MCEKEYFAMDDEYPDLSEEQLEVLNTWEKLSVKEKAAIEKMASSIIDMR